MDDVETWLDTTGDLIDKYERREKEPDDDGKDARDQGVPQVEEEMVHVVEEVLVSF